MTVRVAVIGAGIMGSDHARIIVRDVPGASLQVVCDVSKAAARRTADACSAQDASTDGPATLERDDVDAVIIASPDETHADLVLAALKLRKPVLCEKPLAVSARDCLDLVEAECAIGRRLVQVGFMRRFDPPYAEMKAALNAGRIGAATMMHNFHRNVEAPPHFSGSMAITNSAPHEFDIVRHVLDAEIAAVSAFEPKPGSDVGCAPVVMILETSQGQLATVEVNNNAAYGYDVRSELVGATGSVSLGAGAPVRLDADLTSGSTYGADWRPRFAEAYRLQDQAWIRSIASGIPAPIAASAWDGYCAALVAEAGVAALSSNRRVAVDLAERPALYSGTEVAE